MVTDCRMCVKYDIIEDHTLGRKGSIGGETQFMMHTDSSSDTWITVQNIILKQSNGDRNLL